jgi:hypothetical protein
MTSLAGALVPSPAWSGALVQANAIAAATAPMVHLVVVFLMLVTAVSLGWVFMFSGSVV